MRRTLHFRTEDEKSHYILSTKWFIVRRDVRSTVQNLYASDMQRGLFPSDEISLGRKMHLVTLNNNGTVGDEDGEEIMSNSAYMCAACVLSLIAVFGTLFNLIVITVIIKNAQTLFTPVNVVLLNLVIGDFLVAILGTPVALVSAVARKWYWNHAGCIGYAWFMSTLGMASIGNLTVLAIERWLLVTRPMNAFTTRQASYLASGVWIYALSLSIPPLCGWGSYGPEAGNLSCSVSWEAHDPSTGSDSYIAFLFFFGLFLPVIMIVCSYSGIIRTLKTVRKRSGSRGRYEAKVTKMVAIMIVTFIIAWTPYAIFALSAQYLQTVPTKPALALLPSLFAKASICYNPLIYAGMNTQFRGVLKKFLGFPENTATRSGLSQHTPVTATNRVIIVDKV